MHATFIDFEKAFDKKIIQKYLLFQIKKSKNAKKKFKHHTST